MTEDLLNRNTISPKTFNLGSDLEVNRLGYGAMRLTGQPGNFGPYADWEGGKICSSGLLNWA
jgi:pyridoxine 4-dehydrogenase